MRPSNPEHFSLQNRERINLSSLVIAGEGKKLDLNTRCDLHHYPALRERFVIPRVPVFTPAVTYMFSRKLNPA